MKPVYEPNITPGLVIQHREGTVDEEAALIDIAQDLLLRELNDQQALDALVFKGGTALRKLYAGKAGRFSTDLDFSVRDIGDDAEVVQELLVEIVDGLKIGPFTYGIEIKRGKRILTIETSLGSTGRLASKLDVNPPPWLPPDSRGWVALPVHKAYDGPLPALQCMQIEENIAEKVARLNRTTTARDVYDLVWLWTVYRPGEGEVLDPRLVRRLAVLKIWVDTFGLNAPGTAWKAGHEPSRGFDPQSWLRVRKVAEFDREDIGFLTTPPPDLGEQAKILADRFKFLGDLDSSESQVAKMEGADRPLVLRMLGELPGARLASGCW